MHGSRSGAARIQRAPLISFWCMWTVMQVSRLVRWMRVRLVFSVMPTISRRMASAFLAAFAIAVLSVFAAVSAA